MRVGGNRSPQRQRRRLIEVWARNAGRVVAAALFVALATGPAWADSIELRGSGTVALIMRSLAEDYMRSQPATIVTVSAGGSWWGFKSVIDGTADIAMASDEPTDDLAALVKERGIKLTDVTLGLDAVAPIVSDANTLTDISLAQLRDIYRGKIAKWSAIGGADLAIEVLTGEATSGTFEIWNERVLGYGAVITPTAKIVAGPQLAQRLKDNPGAIAYTTLAFVSGFKSLSVDGVAASADSVRTHRYAIARPLKLFARDPVRPELKKFIDFALGPAGQAIVAKQKFVTVSGEQK